ncbi:MAG: DUF898 domain-containing protein [Gammaproteobacteria bacterium]|nr:DUF898 domain-containing protein [Gammaproteobacteria bacterium]
MNDMSQADEPAAVESRKPSGFEFRGDGMEYFKIWIVNILLTILTLGIYSAWATVRNNRYFYSNLYLGDNNFRYLAEPIQILKGRLIAIAALVAFTVTSQIAPMIGLGLMVLLLIAIPYFVNQSLAFNNRMSAYKNLQFRFKGTYGEAFMVLYVWPLVGLLTLGILYPLALLRLNQYLVRNSSYGTTPFTFDATFGDYGKIFLIMFGAGIVLAIPSWAIVAFMPSMAVVVPVFMVAVYFGLIVFFMVKTTNLFYGSLALADHGFDADLQFGGLAKVILINTLLTIITLGLYLPAAKVRMAKYVCSCMVMHAAGPLDDFVAAEKESVSALGDEFGQAFDFAV